jgi:hypothetical protein
MLQFRLVSCCRVREKITFPYEHNDECHYFIRDWDYSPRNSEFAVNGLGHGTALGVNYLALQLGCLTTADNNVN